MREIKFRGKHIKGGWRYGFLIRSSLDDALSEEVMIYYFDRVGITEMMLPIKAKVDPATVGQYTGLHDSEGREIYEGDIVECVTGRICKVCYFMSPSHCGFDLLPVGGYNCKAPNKTWLWSELKVIGNFYDNPDLLKVKS